MSAFFIVMSYYTGSCEHIALCPPGLLCYNSVWRPLAGVSSDPETEAWPHWTCDWHRRRTALAGLAVYGQKLQCVWNAEWRAFTYTRLSQLSSAAQVGMPRECLGKKSLYCCWLSGEKHPYLLICWSICEHWWGKLDWSRSVFKKTRL